jgi:hypothetical protein
VKVASKRIPEIAMADDEAKLAPHRARKFAVSRDRLAEAMEAVGHSAEKVGAYLTENAADWRSGISMMIKRRRR